MNTKLNRALLIIYVIFSILILLVSLYIYNIGKDYLNVKKSEFLGNTSSVVNLLKQKEGKDVFSFAFVSDTENSDISIWLFKTLLKEDIDFLVLVGDFVNDSIISEHKLFLYTISKLNPKIPIFTVPANHDIEPEGSEWGPNRFSKNSFIDLYGPANFSFVYNNCLFIFISNINQEDPECISYLGSILSKRSSKIKRTFVFCPTPLRMVLNKVMQPPQWTGELDRLVEEYRVDYVISGDYHKHLEITDSNNIQYIVSGSGGAHYGESSFLGRFKNGTRVTVFPDAVMKEIVVCDRKIIFTDNSIRHYLYNNFVSVLKPAFWLVNSIMVLFIINALFSVYCFIRRIEI